MHLEWQETYESGNPSIDREHRELFSLGNTLLEAVHRGQPDGVVLDAFDRLVGAIERHFRNEEAILAEHDYSRLELHQKEHERLLGRAMELAALARAGGVPMDALTQFTARELIARHFLTSDRDFFPLLKQKVALIVEAGRKPENRHGEDSARGESD